MLKHVRKGDRLKTSQTTPQSQSGLSCFQQQLEILDISSEESYLFLANIAFKPKVKGMLVIL